jgi:hypothetical protein
MSCPPRRKGDIGRELSEVTCGPLSDLAALAGEVAREIPGLHLGDPGDSGKPLRRVDSEHDLGS